MAGKLEDLVYIRRVVFGLDAYNEALRQLKAQDGNAPGQNAK